MAQPSGQSGAITLKFASLKSEIELPFYAALASFKINHDKLNDSPRRVVGVYEIRPTDEPGNSCRVQLHGGALTSDDVPAGHFRVEGMIRNMNTIEDYRNLDMAAILNQTGRTIWEAIHDGTIYSCPSLLVSLTMLCFADLKRYNFTYVCGFPALHSESPWLLKDGAQALSTRLSSAETTALVDTVQTWRYSVDNRQYGFFLAKRVHGESASQPLQDDDEGSNAKLGFEWVVDSLGKFEQGFFNGIGEADRFICFADPSTHPQYPAWMLRNLLVLVRKRWNLTEAQVLCYRDTPPRRHESRSLILQVRVQDPSSAEATPSTTIKTLPRISGWEKNPSGKITHRITKLGEHLDPHRLADQAVDLNLKLIKWRIAPKLDLDVIKNTKCLLLGAGTLGSYVARNLMGWGVQHITFVDNGRVSYSNPVRQPLFNFADCVDGGKPKAPRAAEALREIYPGVKATGHILSVPMAGHPIMDEQRVKKDFIELEALINNHDVTFLLMDTRESRWLPTVIGKANGKLVMNAALGFDTFVVLRHGVKKRSADDVELGCYFCNDVVAPADSLSDRTLDQQCTVTRPGGAAIASALLVELMVSVLQHKEGIHAPAPFPGEAKQEDPDHPLGDVPHQVRGFLSNFSNTIISGKCYDCCSACSDRITDAYSKDGWNFVKRALNEKGYVEDISGLAEVQRAAEQALANVEWETDEQDSGFDSEVELL